MNAYSSWDTNGDGGVDAEEIRFKTNEQLADFFDKAGGSDEAKRFFVQLPVYRLASLIAYAHKTGQSLLQGGYLADLNPGHLRSDGEFKAWYQELQVMTRELGKYGRKPDTFNETDAGKVAVLLEGAYEMVAPADSRLTETIPELADPNNARLASNRELDHFFREQAGNPTAIQLFNGLPERRIASLLFYMNYMRPYETTYFSAVAMMPAERSARVADAILEFGCMGVQKDVTNFITYENAKKLADQILINAQPGKRRGTLELISDREYRESRLRFLESDSATAPSAYPQALLDPEQFLAAYIKLSDPQTDPALKEEVYVELYGQVAASLPHTDDLAPYIRLAHNIFNTDRGLFGELLAKFSQDTDTARVNALLVFLEDEQLAQLSEAADSPRAKAALEAEARFRTANPSYRLYAGASPVPSTANRLTLKKYGAQWCNPCFGERKTLRFWSQYFNRYYPERRIFIADLDIGDDPEKNPSGKDWMKFTEAQKYFGVPAYSVEFSGKRVDARLGALDADFFRRLQAMVSQDRASK